MLPSRRTPMDDTSGTAMHNTPSSDHHHHHHHHPHHRQDTRSARLSTQALLEDQQQGVTPDEQENSPVVRVEDKPSSRRHSHHYGSRHPALDGAASGGKRRYAEPKEETGSVSSAALSSATVSRSRLIKVRYQKRRVLGRGSFGQALLVNDLRTGEAVVVKRLKSRINPVGETKKKNPPGKRHAAAAPACTGDGSSSSHEDDDAGGGHIDQAALKESMNEVKALASVRHPYVVRFREAWVESEDDHLHIAMEYCPGGDLESFMKRHYPVDERVVLRWTAQSLLAVEHLHQRRIIHRDIKLQNIFLSADYRSIKVGDFGLSKLLQRSDEGAFTQAGTPYYFSPEMALGHPHDRKTDIWSLGVVLYAVLENRLPYRGASSLFQLLEAIAHKEPPPMTRGMRYSASLVELVFSMLTKSPSSRPSAAALLKSTFLQPVVRDLKAEMSGAPSAAVAAGDTPARGSAPQQIQQQQAPQQPRRGGPSSMMSPARRLAMEAAIAAVSSPATNAPTAHTPPTCASPIAGGLAPPTDGAAERKKASPSHRDPFATDEEDQHQQQQQRVQLDGGGDGGGGEPPHWLTLKKITLQQDAGKPRGSKQVKMAVNLRRDPTLASDIVARIQHGTKVYVEGRAVTGGDGAPWLRVLRPVQGYCIAMLDGQGLFRDCQPPSDSAQNRARILDGAGSAVGGAPPAPPDRRQHQQQRRHQHEYPEHRVPSTSSSKDRRRPLSRPSSPFGHRPADDDAAQGFVPTPPRSPVGQRRPSPYLPPASRHPRPLRRKLEYDEEDGEDGGNPPDGFVSRRVSPRPSAAMEPFDTDARIAAARERRAERLSSPVKVARSPLPSPRWR